MGESIADLRTFPDKMIGETTVSNPALEVSVSFGRFENDSLSWEKWSAFSPNKYLEEVEKCATPGSVAQKKAYFEAHYKKIAARKAELLEQERLAQSESNERDPANNGRPNRGEIDVSEDQISADEVKRDEIGSGSDRDDLKEEALVGDECKSFAVEREDKIDSSKVNDECNSSVSVVIDECQSHNSSVSVVIDECQSLVAEREEEIGTRVVGDECPSLVVERKEEIDSTVIIDKPSELEDVVATEVEVVSVGSKPKKEEEAPASVDSQSVCDSKIEDKMVKSVNKKESRKITLAIKERVVLRPKKKPISPNPITRTPKGSISRVTNSRPVSASSRVSMSSFSESSAKKASSPPLLRNKTTSAGEAKKVAPKSIQMPLGLGHSNSNSPSLTTNRKSLIMEKMGDKDIVKRAFKAFQNNFNQVRSYGDESPLQKQVQVSSKRTEPKVSTSITPRKENGGLLKTDRQDKRSVKTPPSSFGLKSIEREEKRKEFTKKPELKSNTTSTEKTHLQTRTKEAKETETKKLRESLNFKATPMPAFYRGQKTSKSALDKIPTKTVTRR